MHAPHADICPGTLHAVLAATKAAAWGVSWPRTGRRAGAHLNKGHGHLRAAGELQNATLFSFEGGLADGEGVLIKNSHANDKWLHEAFGGAVMAAVRQYPISCSGGLTLHASAVGSVRQSSWVPATWHCHGPAAAYAVYSYPTFDACSSPVGHRAAVYRPAALIC